MATRVHKKFGLALALLCAAALAVAAVFAAAPGLVQAQAAPGVGFGKSTLQGESSAKPTSLQFGPDGRLYVAQQDGSIKAYTVKRNGPNKYAVSSTETINQIKSIPNHNDDGTLNTGEKDRQVTGILVAGTEANPVIYVTSSDPRIGAGPDGNDKNLDTNSGVVSKLTKTTSGWQKVDLVQGLPRSEENHSQNGMQLSADGKTLYVTSGGNTNQGAPSKNFAELPEYALSAAVLSVDLAAIGNTTYKLPTIGTSPNQPFGGDDGKNQAKIVPGGPVQVYSPGFRNAYDVLIAGSGKMYTVDNGGNAGWGDVPINEGSGGTCTNGLNEPGETNADQLHLISGKGYYGGHPNPTRGNPAGSGFSGAVPAPNPIECAYQKPGAALTTFPASTNGLAEYTASNFGEAMKGDLLTVGFDNKLYRVELDAAGTGVLKKDALFNAVGTTPLDVTAQGAGGPFPGTVWVADIFANSVVVFEPNDFGGQTPPPACDASDPNGDADGDGFKNQDEKDNGTDPCSAADMPPDWDKDGISDKNDPDDDNDGQNDNVDPFALDPKNGTGTKLPVRYTWDNDAAAAGGLFNTGFTGLMTNGQDDYQDLYDQANMTSGAAAGVLTVDKVSGGDAVAGENNQQNAFQFGFQFGVDASEGSGTFTARTRVAAPFAGMQPQDYQSMGLFLGTGNQGNYVKLVTSANGGKGGIEFAKEVDDQFTNRPQPEVPMPGPDWVDLFLTVDPAAKTVQPSYVVSTNGKAGPRTDLGGPEPIPDAWIDSSKALAVGIISTSYGGAPAFPATWDFIEVVPGKGSTEPPPPGTPPPPPPDPTPKPSPQPDPGPPADTTPPNTRITSGPPALTNSRTARFHFRSTEAGSRFQCRVDGGRWRGCSSPATLRRVGDGRHALEVRAVDRAGNADRTPARWAWRVDARKPLVKALGPKGTTRDRTPTLRAVVRDGGAELSKRHVRLYVDGKQTRRFSYDRRRDRLSYTGRLSVGRHTVRVVATDPAGNRTVETWRFRVIRNR